MHRNTYLVVGILAVLAALVVGVNVGKKLTPQPVSSVPAPAQEAAVTPTPAILSYTDTACGFGISYSPDFTLQENATGSAILNFNNDQSKSILMTCQKDIPRPPIPANRIEKLFIPSTSGASVSAKLYHDSSAKDGTPIDAVIFTHPAKKLDVFISGYGDAFNSLIKTIRILP